MGEVYRARDTRLERSVAIKVLPAGLASDPERRKRFEREAKAISALSHPNICALFDVGRHDVDGGAIDYLVMELLEGETLASRLRRGPLPTNLTLKVGAEISSALDKAHRQGIIHRDLKPANVILAKSGAKLLDFGLAKLREAERAPGGSAESASALSALPTDSDSLTDAGRLMGTYPYMAPEQLGGQDADARTDLFALGCVLYEMATGTKAFRGDTPTSVMRAILTLDPLPILSVRPAAPSNLDRLVRVCLAKDPDDRLQTAHDVMQELEWIAEDPGGVETSDRTGRRRARLGWWWATTTVLLLATAGITAWISRNRWDRPLPQYKQLTFRRGTVDKARFTADGNTVIYSAVWDAGPSEMFSVRLDRPESISLGLPPASLLSVSSQGELAVLLQSPGERSVVNLHGTLARVPVTGGAVRPVLENVYNADWSPDGNQLAVSRLDERLHCRVEFPIGTVLLSQSGCEGLRVSPTGDLVAVGLNDDTTIAIVDRTGTKRAALHGGPNLAGFSWSPKGDALIVAAGDSPLSRTVRRLGLDGTAREIGAIAGTVCVQDTAPGGRILAHHGFERLGVRVHLKDQDERDLGIFAWSLLSGLSHDGTQALLIDQTRPTVMYLRPTTGGPAVRLAEGTSYGLSHDGRWVLMGSENGKAPRLVPTGAGDEIVLPLEHITFAGAWRVAPDRVGVHGSEAGRPNRSFLVDLASRKIHPVTPENVYAVSDLLPGGRVVGLGDQGALALYPAGGEGDPQPLPWRWRPEEGFVRTTSTTADGRYIFAARGWLPVEIERIELLTGRRTPWKTIGPQEAGLSAIFSADLTQDGQGYAYHYGLFLHDLYLVDGLRY